MKPIAHCSLLCGLIFLSFCNPVGAQESQPAAALPSTPEEPSVRSVKFDDWYYRCVDVKGVDATVATNCEVAQIAQVKQDGKDVSILTLAIARTAPSAQNDKKHATDFLLTALVPLNVFLPAGFGLNADGKAVAHTDYRNCNQAGCWAQQKLDAKMLASMRASASGEGSLRLMNGQNINIKFSLKGLATALAELQKPTVAQ